MSTADVGSFPIGGLLNGDAYQTSTRMKNISAAMTWIHSQLQSLKESDKQLLTLFNKLETDMTELKSIYGDGRRRNSSISSIRDVYAKSSQGSILQELEQDKRLLQPPQIDLKVSILESVTMISHSSSENSLDDFANELGLDDDDDVSHPYRGRPSVHSQVSLVSGSTENDINFSISLPRSSLPEEEDMSVTDINSIPYRYTSSTSDDSPSNDKKNMSLHRLSNDSGAIADSDSTGSGAATEKQELVSDSNTPDKRLSGFADEIFKMLNF